MATSPGGAQRPHLQLHMEPPPAPPSAAATSYARGAGAYTQREEHLKRLEEAGDLRFEYVKNDGSRQNMIW